ncbi:Histidine protein kinase NIK1 [Penicillium freii]|nr:Histidine protein kinase NIK1 [Penicillium freii]
MLSVITNSPTTPQQTTPSPIRSYEKDPGEIPSSTPTIRPVGDLDEDDTDEEDETGATRAVREEDVSILGNHVQKQAEEISFQKDIIAQVRNELQKQKGHTRRALTKVENEDVFLLERELRKH